MNFPCGMAALRCVKQSCHHESALRAKVDGESSFCASTKSDEGSAVALWIGGHKMKNLDSLMAAYLAVWAIFFVYHFTVARRVARLQDEIARLKQNLKQ